jgi:hypothetical protein
LPARFAALRRRITTFAEEFLILGGKRECLPAIAAHELLIFSHISLSSMLLVCSAFEKPSNFAVLPRPLAFAADASGAKSVELIDRFRAIAKSNEFRLELPDRDELCLRRRQGVQRISVSFELSGGLSTQGAAQALPSSVGILKKTGKNREDIRDDLYPACHSTRQRLDSPDVLGLQAFRPFYDVELNRLTFLERAKSLTLDGRMMHEHVFAVCTAKEAESLRIVKPFYCSLFHDFSFVA